MRASINIDFMPVPRHCGIAGARNNMPLAAAGAVARVQADAFLFDIVRRFRKGNRRQKACQHPGGQH